MNLYDYYTLLGDKLARDSCQPHRDRPAASPPPNSVIMRASHRDFHQIGI